jgi:hypothetical protein
MPRWPFAVLFSPFRENKSETTHKIKLFSGANINEKGQERDFTMGRKEEKKYKTPNMLLPGASSSALGMQFAGIRRVFESFEPTSCYRAIGQGLTHELISTRDSTSVHFGSQTRTISRLIGEAN